MYTTIAIVLFIMFMIAAFFVSYFAARYMIKDTGLFKESVIFATMLNVLHGVVAIFSWFFYSIDISESLFINGLLMGLALLILSELTLVGIITLKRKDYDDYLIQSEKIIKLVE
ncbi:hypothetical protein [Aquibacillus rhizosphaerae]|uniref:DUF4870 domain-containing protein n=1 Tax=Aquibacillus rhizosphaerae TaxID=3051431 RepID=A0ABT7LB72_9BACI|nr:hypothetical protein [Aquibacillus sp. LR5S19]MDL4843118.1 hypothetical protein [Aquibacillus sp. LR5S19]